jgi:predicted nucleic acid-binding protein
VYLLDTDVLSLTSPTSQLTGAAAERWRSWVGRNEAALHLSAITLMEVRYGVERLRLRGASRRAADLARWLLIVETIYIDRIVWISPEIADRAGVLLARCEAGGIEPGAEDALIAASAEVQGFRLLSRNARHMAGFGIAWANPIDLAPE